MPPTPAPSIAFRDVGQVFTTEDGRPVRALRDLSFTVAQHEFVSVLGPSGCGKSTLLRLLAGLITPTEGGIEINGDPVRAPRDEIGIVFQRPVLLPWLTIAQNVTFPRKHKLGVTTAQDRDRAAALLRLVGLEDFADRRPDALSGGMQQRAAIARALLLDPEILLMDEPFSALDALTRDEMSFELLRIWADRPKTVLFITHSIPEALLLSDRLIIMSGRPGAVREEIAVPFARPRTLATLSDPRFTELANHIRHALFSRPVA